MSKNLELKARISSVHAAEFICHAIHARRSGLLRQADTYFRIRPGRLKLREFHRGPAELIFYLRPNTAGGRFSNFTRRVIHHPRAVKRALSQTLGRKCVVHNNRMVFRYKNARIHLDRVRGLGTFLEFEVLVTRGVPQARSLFRFLVTKFGIRSRRLIAGSYSDMILRKGV